MAKSNSSNPETKPDDKDERQTCFLIMPFHEPFFLYCETIFEPAADNSNLRLTRVDDPVVSTEIRSDMWRMIQEATVCIAVLSNPNLNVFYELGLAHAQSKPVVLVADNLELIPFDLRGYRIVIYHPTQKRWWETLKEDLSTSLKQTLANPIKAIPSMFVEKVPVDRPKEEQVSSQLGEILRNIRILVESQITAPSLHKGAGTSIPFGPSLSDLIGPGLSEQITIPGAPGRTMTVGSDGTVLPAGTLVPPDTGANLRGFGVSPQNTK